MKPTNSRPADRREKTSPCLSRRSFFAAGTAVLATPSLVAAAQAETPQNAAPAPARTGYQETEHVRAYYRRANF